MALFQYQQRAEPLIPIVPPPPPPLNWQPSYPDTVPHRRSRLAPFLAFVAIPPAPSTTEVRLTQAVVETTIAVAAPLVRVTATTLEGLLQPSLALRQLRVTQIAVEILYPFGCYVFVPPLPPACAVEFSAGPNAQPCADETPVFP